MRVLVLVKMLLFLLIFSLSAQALQYRTMDVELDITQNPPTFKIKTYVLAEPHDRKATVEVRAMWVGVDDPEKFSAALGTAGYVDQDGKSFVARNTFDLANADGSKTFETLVVEFPYNAMWVGNQAAKYNLGFQVTVIGTKNNEPAVDFVAPSDLGQLEITPGQAPTFHYVTDLPPVPAERIPTKVTAKVFPRVVPGGATAPQETTIEIMADSPKGPVVGGGVPFGDPGLNALKNRVGAQQPGRSVYFATNREVVNPQKKDGSRFSRNQAGKVTYGLANVNIPLKHKRGQLEQTTHWWKFGKDKNEIFRVLDLSEVDPRAFLAQVSKDDILLFVHGFANSFDDAVSTVAQIGVDINYFHNLMAFSWPSLGDATKYSADEAIADAEPIPLNQRNLTKAQAEVKTTIVALADVIENLTRWVQYERASGHPERKIHIIAHSMGNRLLVRAFRNLEMRDRKALQDKVPNYVKILDRQITNVVLAAPDVTTSQFDSHLPSVVKGSQQTTFYYSSYDFPLDLSKTKHWRDRAGSYPYFIDGMETVCANNINSRFVGLGHSYVRSSDAVLDDLMLLIGRGQTADFRRPPLTAKSELQGYEGFFHYQFLVNP